MPARGWKHLAGAAMAAASLLGGAGAGPALSGAGEGIPSFAVQAEIPDPPLHPLTALSAGTLTPAQEAYDVRHYGIDLTIDPARRFIEGSSVVTIMAVEALDAIELDLDPRFAVTGTQVDGVATAFVRDENKLTVALPVTLAPGTQAAVTVAYSGHPHQAELAPWRGGFDWKETPDGKPWIATAIQGRGCDLFRPCKDHFGDKPDEGVSLSIEVPEGLAVATNGVLKDVAPAREGYRRWNWETRFPTTGYAVALNIGPYVRIEERWDTPDGRAIPVEFWALPESEAQARTLLAEDGRYQLAFFEEMLGPYPWAAEKLGFAETAHLGMEHQTINAYGNRFRGGPHGYDWLLFHEMAHEWFGNLMTQARIPDLWLHEGYASFMEAAYTERLRGSEGYGEQLRRYAGQLYNCRPVVDETAAHIEDVFTGGDIYTKGGWALHTLREQIGAEAFWTATRRLLYGTDDPYGLEDPSAGRYRSTADFLRIMSEEAGRDVRPLVGPYLFEAALPVLNVERDGDVVWLAWQRTGEEIFELPVTVDIDGERQVIDMPWGNGFFRAPQEAAVTIDPDGTVLRVASPALGVCRQ